MRSVTILGATGSVGTSTLDLIERDPDTFKVLALTANCDVEGLAAAAKRVGAKLAVVADESCLPALREALAGSGVDAAGGADAVCD
ncbi:MAG TPA: 1-deoxy-D-xylulose-5-phosphate reductoisomerase, partial [Sphingomonas sp.]|nr:1-deoxy-D-xylulose-5-phosphate reductoisomerase [Sphingomonas sp.]